MKLFDLLLASILLASISVPAASQVSAITCEDSGNGDAESFDIVGDYYGVFFEDGWAYFLIGTKFMRMKADEFPINEPEQGERMIARNCSHDPEVEGGFICESLWKAPWALQ